MIIEMILFLTFAVAMGAITVKAYEWRQDVLYGPYILPTFSHQDQRVGKQLSKAPHRWSRRFGSFALISTMCSAMLSWLGFLVWGMFSSVRWLLQLI
jgi:hypothetical protein